MSIGAASILSSVAAFVAGAIAQGLGLAALAIVAFVMPSRWLWHFRGTSKADDVKLIVSQREPEQTRSHALPITGLGQIQAVAAISPSLVRCYGWRWRDPLCIEVGADNFKVKELMCNLILIGGASGNAGTRRFLEEQGEALGIRQEHGHPEFSGDRFLIRNAEGAWQAFGGRPVDQGSGPVTDDYALVVRMPNPWNERKQCVLLAGVDTFGTGAAASYFVKQWWKPIWWSRKGVVALLRISVRDETVVATSRMWLRRL